MKKITVQIIAGKILNCGVCYERRSRQAEISSIKLASEAGRGDLAFVRNENEARQTRAECVVADRSLKPWLSRVPNLILLSSPQAVDEAQELLEKEFE